MTAQRDILKSFAGPRKHLRYPFWEPEAPTLIERIALRGMPGVKPKRFGPILCPACGRRSYARDFSDDYGNMRETGICMACGSTNRQRQMAYMTCEVVGKLRDRQIRSLPALASLPDLRIHNTESRGPVHEPLSKLAGYTCSEYFGPDYKSGELVDGVMHQDLMSTSFESGSLDILLSSDVFEHIPDPYAAHAEVHRVLKPGGRHIFTVPFYQTEHLDEVRARLDDDGKVEHLMEPIYHGDPVRESEGALVYTIFSIEMLARLRELGFITSLYLVYRPSRGILGMNGVVFEAVKRV
jgi:Methyltransferase domain